MGGYKDLVHTLLLGCPAGLRLLHWTEGYSSQRLCVLCGRLGGLPQEHLHQSAGGGPGFDSPAGPGGCAGAAAQRLLREVCEALDQAQRRSRYEVHLA